MSRLPPPTAFANRGARLSGRVGTFVIVLHENTPCWGHRSLWGQCAWPLPDLCSNQAQCEMPWVVAVETLYPHAAQRLSWSPAPGRASPTPHAGRHPPRKPCEQSRPPEDVWATVPPSAKVPSVSWWSWWRFLPQPTAFLRCSTQPAERTGSQCWSLPVAMVTRTQN